MSLSPLYPAESHEQKPQDPSTITHKEVSPKESTMLGLGFAWDLGYTIAIPAIIFGLGGRYLDHTLHSSPVFLLIGLLLAFTISFITIAQKLRYILHHMPKDLPRKKKEVDVEITKEQEILHDLFRPPSP